MCPLSHTQTIIFPSFASLQLSPICRGVRVPPKVHPFSGGESRPVPPAESAGGGLRLGTSIFQALSLTGVRPGGGGDGAGEREWRGESGYDMERVNDSARHAEVET